MENLGAVQYIQEGFALMSHLIAKLPSKVQYQWDEAVNKIPT